MADLIDEIRSIAAKIERSSSMVQTEEATKNAYVMPFIAALGYDVFDPAEVTPELVADVGVKKGEKVDYAILKDGKPIMIFECKHHAVDLANEHASQLYRYFSTTDCRVAVLTNGIQYRFFTDLEAPNKMDAKPFLVFSMLDFPPAMIPELKKFAKDAFDLTALLSTANELKYTREIKQVLAAQLAAPSEEFVRFCAQTIGIPRMTPAIKEQLTALTRKAFSEFISEQMGEKLKTALGPSAGSVDFAAKPAVEAPAAVPPSPVDSAPTIVTTPEELEGFYAVKSILNGVVDLARVVHRDQQSYFGILLDDNNRRPIARLRFNGVTKKFVGLFDADRNEERIEVQGVDDIYGLADRIRATVERYAGASPQS